MDDGRFVAAFELQKFGRRRQILVDGNLGARSMEHVDVKVTNLLTAWHDDGIVVM